MTAALRIDIVSDVVCPWCFIGKRHLDRALAGWRADHPGREVEVRWHPYFLNPDTPETGEPYRPFLEQKFGGAAAVDALLARVAEAGRIAGVTFAFERIALRANTLHAHRLIHHAQKVGAGATAIDALVERLFAAHFLNGEHLGDAAVLGACAEAAGLGMADIGAYLASGEDRAEVEAAAREARDSGIGGVPFFIFGGRLSASGAQPPEALRQAMEQAFATP